MKAIQVQRPDRMGAAGTCRWRVSVAASGHCPLLSALGPGLALGRWAVPYPEQWQLPDKAGNAAVAQQAEWSRGEFSR